MPVKGEPGSHRQRQALATRQQVATAARVMFAERGYVATTIAVIAEAARIPAPTIYSAFGTKAAILHEIGWGAVATLDIDRSHEEALRHPDPDAGLRLAANIQRRQYEVMYDVVAVYQEAARTDRDTARELEVILATRERAFRRHLSAIEGHLAVGLTLEHALDIYLALVLPEVYRTLVIDRGWSHDHYERWLAGAFAHQLLARATK